MFHNFIRLHCTSCGNEIDVPVYCGDRFCPICSSGRRKRIRDRIKFLVENSVERDGAAFSHLTLTIKSRPDLPGMIKSITHSFRKLRNSQLWKSHVYGGAFVLEITKSDAGWHAHIHAVIYNLWIDYFELRNAWSRCSTGMGVYITRLPKNQIIYYLTKYLTKPEASVEELAEINDELKGARLFTPFGDWFKLAKQFKKPRCACSKCDQETFVNVHMEIGQGTGMFWKEVRLDCLLYEKDLQPGGPEFPYLAEFDIDDFPFGTLAPK